MGHRYFIQYHNTDNMGGLPDDIVTDDIEKVEFNTAISDGHGFFTSKQTVLKEIGSYCFLIVGTGKKSKKYYLWSFFMIDEVYEEEDGMFQAYGTGFNFRKPILLNELDGFADFKNYCGNFGLGFQNITTHPFCKTLVDFSNNIEIETDILPQSDTQELFNALDVLNTEMQNIEPEKRLAEVELTLRNDKRIVTLLKRAANFKCQFPDCTAQIKTKAGINYVEVAHIHPVNKGGQSILGNMVVLCPNHHKEFDFGDLKITEQTSEKLSGTLNGKNFQINLRQNGS